MLSLLPLTLWYTNWDMWSAVGQLIGSIGAVGAVWVAVSTASKSQKISERSLQASEQSIEVAKKAIINQQQILTDERTPSIELFEDTTDHFYFKVVATNVKTIPITIEESCIQIRGVFAEEGSPITHIINSLIVSEPLPHMLKQGDYLTVSISKFKLRKYVLIYMHSIELKEIVFVFSDSMKKSYSLKIGNVINEHNDIRISEFEPYGAYVGSDIDYDPLKDDVEIVPVENSKFPHLRVYRKEDMNVKSRNKNTNCKN